MDKVKLYKEFRKELDEYAVPLIINNVNYVTLMYENEKVGFACLVGDYLDAFYILPEYRRKGIGTIMVKNLYKKHKFKRLHIINRNIPALEFWKKNFKLKEIEFNFCDTLYEIEGEKNNGNKND